MFLTIPSVAEVIVYTDRATMICVIESGFSLKLASVQKQFNFLMTEKIVDLIKIKKISLELNKIKGHSNNKWNNFLDKLAKKGCKVLETIQVEVGKNLRFQ
ncbi:16847_t:CDS:1, partial [Gigaspora rosea]